MFKVDIRPFETGRHQVRRTPTAEDIDLEAVSSEDGTKEVRDIQVIADLICERRRILVHLQAAATFTLKCDRTLQLFDSRLEGSYSVLFASPEARPSEESDEYDEVRTFSPSDPSLDLTDLVRDTLLLTIPQRKVAPGAEELELATSFGDDTNESEDPVDPRWEELRQLRDE